MVITHQDMLNLHQNSEKKQTLNFGDEIYSILHVLDSINVGISQVNVYHDSELYMCYCNRKVVLE